MIDKYKHLIIMTLFTVVFSACGKMSSPSYSSDYGDLSTVYSEDWDNWKFDLDTISGKFHTTYSNDWDNWQFETNNFEGRIDTKYSNEFDQWNLDIDGYDIEIFTLYSDEYDSWKVKDHDSNLTYYVRTAYSDDYDNWVVELNGEEVMTMRTDYSDDYDNWQFDNIAVEDEVHLAGILFIAVFTSSVPL